MQIPLSAGIHYRHTRTLDAYAFPWLCSSWYFKKYLFLEKVEFYFRSQCGFRERYFLLYIYIITPSCDPWFFCYAYYDIQVASSAILRLAMPTEPYLDVVRGSFWYVNVI